MTILLKFIPFLSITTTPENTLLTNKKVSVVMDRMREY